MDHRAIKDFPRHNLTNTISAVLITAALLYAHIKIYTLENRVALLSESLITTQTDLASTTNTLSLSTRTLAESFSSLSRETFGISTILDSAQKNIEAVKSQVGGVEQSVGSISGTVGNLQKLSEIDPQLLKKYSKVYFMNENYVPAHLTVVPQEYTYSTKRSEQFVSEAWPFLKNLLDAAKANGVTIYTKSAYRSFAEQKSLKSSYAIVYGAGTANSFSAEQGYSEHQLGTTLDFTTTGLNGGLTGFDGTPAYEWLRANAHRYGFVLSYPKGNKYYVYEPWHWRYVGIKLATYIHNNNLNFYNIDQREIDKYLISTFDTSL